LAALLHYLVKYKYKKIRNGRFGKQKRHFSPAWQQLIRTLLDCRLAQSAKKGMSSHPMELALNAKSSSSSVMSVHVRMCVI